ncbi:hypothetical protein [Nocardioides sp. SR21]|uniref:hypothetical protein n=1 Tax=Nocardioides sp. SR21 TaxID=2919501 RepID=UPI001FAAAFA9|nr:hypothetical protein [Nocardioides sp. SR21]
MTTLHDRLAELADDVPSGGPAPDLWDRGRRYRRARLAGTVVIVAAAAVVVALVAGISWQRSVPPAPQPAGTPAGLPDRVYAPSRWLPGTDDEGPLGQLAAVVSAERGSWTGTSYELVGISATTGEYRFLDVPGSGEVESALAPDGRHIAYWLTGEPSGAPNGDAPIVGFAVYDTTTGDTVRQAIETEHGLAVDDLAWADDHRLVLDYGQWAEAGDGDGMSNRYGTWTWDLTTGAAPIRLDGENYSSFASVVGDGKVVVSMAKGYGLLDLDDPGDDPLPIRIRRSDNMTSTPVVDPRGQHVAGVWGGSDLDGQSVPNKVKAGSVPAGGGFAELSLVPDSARSLEVLQWTGPTEIAVIRAPEPDAERVALQRLDVETGTSTAVTTYDWNDGNQPTFATDLLGAPTFDAEEPPGPLDPRLVAGLIVGTVLVAAGLLLLWRRRVRP